MQRLLDFFYNCIVVLFMAGFMAAAVIVIAWLLWLFFSVLAGGQSTCQPSLC